MGIGRASGAGDAGPGRAVAAKHGALAAGLALVLGCGGADEAPGPNVIVLLSDQHRWHAMGHTALPELETPTLDRIAREGASFELAISNYPLCTPFRGMLMSGRWPYQTGALDNGMGLARGEPTLAQVFGRAGYETGYIGKLHLASWTATHLGFDRSIVWQDSDDHRGGRWVADRRDVWTANEGRYNAAVMTDQALAWIDAMQNGPFLLVVSWNPPHAVFTDPPAAKEALYRDPPLPTPANYRAPERYEDPAAVYRGYHAHVSALDDEIARVLAHLEERRLADRTVVVYTSDHGAMQGSHGLTNKRFPFDESIRVPFLVHAPGRIAPGVEIAAPFGAIDMAPTIAGLAGVEPAAEWVGTDFSPRLRGEPAAVPTGQPIMHVLNRRTERLPPEQRPAPRFRGIRTARWTYAVRANGPWLLFDNERDPDQLDNLAHDPAHAGTRRQLAEAIAAWLVEAEDPFVLPASAWQ